MRNDDAAFRDIAEHDRQESPAELPDDGRPPAEAGREKNKPFIASRDPDDDELPSDSSDR